MTKDEALAKLERALKIEDKGDRDRAHRYADRVLCDLLKSLGYVDVVRKFNKLPKFYS